MMWQTFAPRFVYLVISVHLYWQHFAQGQVIMPPKYTTKYVTRNPFQPRRRTITSAFAKNELHGHKLNREDKVLMKYLEEANFTVYRADIEMAIGAWMYNGVFKNTIIGGEYLKVLENFTDVLIVFNPLNRRSLKFLQDFKNWLRSAYRIWSFEVHDWAECWENKFGQVFNVNDYVGCHGSKPHLRGFPCCLWQLFHFLTVEGADFNEGWFTPIFQAGHVIRVITDFIRTFYRNHNPQGVERFMTIANQKTFDVRSHNEEIFWLWEVHNAFNRVTGKKQWPSIQICRYCRQTKKKDHWKRDGVLRFLKRVYRQRHHSLFRLENPQFYINGQVRVSEPSSESQNCETLRRRRRFG